MSERTQASKITICVQYSKVALTQSTRVGIELPGQLKIFGTARQSIQLYITKPLQKDLECSLCNCGAGDFLKFWSVAQRKTAQNKPQMSKI